MKSGWTVRATTLWVPDEGKKAYEREIERVVGKCEVEADTVD